MPFPLRGRNCFIEDIPLELERLGVGPVPVVYTDGYVEGMYLETPKELDAETLLEDYKRKLKVSFNNVLSKNLREFGINLVDQASEAHIKVAVQVLVETDLVCAKGSIVADGTELTKLVVRSQAPSEAEKWAMTISDPSMPHFDWTIEGGIWLAAESLSYRINEALIDFYLDKPEQTGVLPEKPAVPDSGDAEGAGIAERSLAGKFNWSAAFKLLLLAALLGVVVYRYIETDFLQTLRQAAGRYASLTPARQMSAEAYYDRGDHYFRNRRLDQAISDFTKALEINPRLAMAYNYRGLAYSKKGKNDQAISDYTKALEIDPRLAIAYTNRAIVHFRKKEYDKAWEDVRQAQNLGEKIDPKFLQDLRQASGRQN